MMSVRWLEKEPPAMFLSMSISDNSIGFGTLSASEARYATGDGLGTTSSSTVAHTISLAAGGVLGVDFGVLMGNFSNFSCQSCIGIPTISKIATGTSELNTPGTEQYGYVTFGDVSTPGVVGYSDLSSTSSPPYWNGPPRNDLSSYSGVVSGSQSGLLDVYYIANISGDTEAGSYTGNVTYVLTSTY
jgi:hypothetical protein